METFFHVGFEFQGDVLVPVMPSSHDLPSFAQFKFFYYSKYRDPIAETKARNGNTDFLLNYRELTGNSTDMAFGPGSVFQVDATIADIYLLSFDRRKIIGRPVVYIAIDVFSRLIVGMSVILEGPSWLGAMLALDNTFSSKVLFCAEYGIEISEEQWPSHHLPKAILADRGEFEGYNVETLTSAFGITIFNAPPYRADYKGIVERQFRILNERFVSFLPGFVYKHRDRGDPDYRLDAVLTLKEFTTMMIAHVLDHNQNRHLTSYRKDEIMISNEVSRYPVDLWKWGMENRSGHLREIKRDVARMNLLPRKEVSLTPQGLHLERELYYSCDSLVASGLMMRKRGRTYPRVTVAYDPRAVDQVYIPSSDGTNFTICPLTSAAKSFLGLSLYDAQYYFNEETQNNELARSQHIQSRAQFNAVSEHITSKALDETTQIEELDEPISDARRVKDIRKNRGLARDAEREKNKWSFGEDKIKLQQPPVSDSERAVEAEKKHFIKPISNAETIRSIRNKKRGNR